MAHQLHYTSAAAGLAGRPGFQFVAASPGATAAVQQAVAPYLSYRPPPGAPSQPEPAELARFPVSFCYVPEGTTAILAQCRYLGVDYSGRYGNFLGHAVVAPQDALGELPPIALWRSPIWAQAPASAADPPLPELDALPPGEDAGPEPVARWLASTDGELLAPLVEAVLATLDGRAGQVILVADEVGTVARWIAAVSYSLPLAWARRLSFVTYTGDAGRARQHLVGTTTDAWRGGAGHGQVFRLDPPGTAGGRDEPGWYASGLAAAWRGGDRYQLEALNELVSTMAAVPGSGEAGGADRDAVAALAALCRGEPLEPAARSAVAGLVTSHADRLLAWVWDDLASRITVDTGLELALAVHQAARGQARGALADRAGEVAVRLAIDRPADRPRLATVELSGPAAAGLGEPAGAALRAPASLDDLVAVVREARRLRLPVEAEELYAGTAHAVRHTGGPAPGQWSVEDLLREVDGKVLWAAVLKGVVDGLAGATDDQRGRLLTDEVCDLLARRDWDTAPQVGAHVLASRGRRYPAEREAVTIALADLADRGQLGDHELARRLREVWHGGEPSLAICSRLLARATGAQQARQRGVVALARRAFVTGDLGSRHALGLADGLYRVLGRDVRDPAIADATAVRAIHRARTDGAPALLELSAVEGVAEPAVYQRAVAALAGASPASFATAPPALQADVLLRLAPDSALRQQLVRALLGRVEAGTRGAGLNLAHVAILLWRVDLMDPVLTKPVVRLARHPQQGRTLRRGLQERDPPMREELERMIADYQRTRWSRIMSPRWRRG